MTRAGDRNLTKRASRVIIAANMREGVFLVRCSDRIRHHFFTREFLLFLIVGGVNTFNGTFLSWLYAFLIPNHNLAFNCGYLTSNLIAYYLNSTFIFPVPLSLQRCLKFALSYVPNYLIQNLIVLLFYNFLAYPPILSYLVAAVLGIPVTFLCVKIFTF